MPTTATATVLTVEDDPIIRANLRMILEEAGFDVCAAARDGVEAVALAREHRPDLVLLDLGLPRLDGVAVARLISGERAVPIVALTGAASPLLAAALDTGATHHVAKPFSDARLVETLHAALADARSAAPVAVAVADGVAVTDAVVVADAPVVAARPIPAEELLDQRGARLQIERMIRDGYTEREINASLRRDFGPYEEASLRVAAGWFRGLVRAVLGRS